MGMKKCLITEVKPGMMLACPVVNEEGLVVLSEGNVLTDGLIEKIITFNIRYVQITERKSPPEPAQPAGLAAFNAVYDDTIQVIKSCFSSMRYFKEVPLNQMHELVDKSIDPLVGAVGVISHLQAIRRQDDYTFHHSVNVSILSGILGKWIGMSGKELKDLILTGLLHDIGKTQIPLDILNKPAKLTVEEMDIMKKHTVQGYDMLLATQNLTDDILSGVLQHHEKIDGTGYPFGTARDEIHHFAKIIAVADIYDAMTSDRVYQKKRSPFEVVEVIYQEMFGKLDSAVCVAFLSNIRDHFIGAIVKLSDGSEAEIVHPGEYLMSRPIVRTEEGELIDLNRNKQIMIMELA